MAARDQLAGWDLVSRLEFWHDHRRRMAANPQYRAGWSAAVRLKVPAQALRNLEAIGICPELCEHQIRVFDRNTFRCQRCGEMVTEGN
jgi:hypothetical protein